MTVSDLIQKLKQFPPDRVVLVDGYEGGFDILKENLIESIEVVATDYGETYFGKYDYADSASGEDHAFFAVVLQRP